ncbi:DNA polymerase III subunit gamma/tau [Acinetobacter stercoris]|uniref:DNA polymerase III subunit gamma/tau n=1 Tax=Acinetobacter stercoris TaxID=2126983 RepID=A0A2U3MV87_9GAMM|nr:DNA polymerase III subunit gamma/tau [Acinetobacter stercoris]SPL69285.1 DNA polymerase III subunit tau [Acinetobacter stercoris]
MYQVLARKYRPRNFNELVGQNHVSRALTSALDRGRLHHAYLFTGTRGVGKTTIARILAKCLNCETGVTSTPCEVCPTCRAVNEGRFIDLIEIDAASRTKVEDTRELLDNVPYAPTQGRYKVYLIDEVHMLSTHSFNALLKTLEEPPEHVKFLFATTDPQKLPITVISRCLQFTLRPLAVDEITSHLTNILNKEEIKADQDAIWQIAESAQGSLRDALSLTDQAIAYGQGEIHHQDVKEMLGLIDRTIIYDLILAIHQNQKARVSELLIQFRQQALDVSMVLDQFISTLHELALLQYLPDLGLKYSAEINQKITQLSQVVSAQDLQLYYQVACKGRADLQLAVTQEQGFEMTVLRLLAFRPLQANEMPVVNVQAIAQSSLPHANQQSVQQEHNESVVHTPLGSHTDLLQKTEDVTQPENIERSEESVAPLDFARETSLDHINTGEPVTEAIHGKTSDDSQSADEVEPAFDSVVSIQKNESDIQLQGNQEPGLTTFGDDSAQPFIQPEPVQSSQDQDEVFFLNPEKETEEETYVEDKPVEVMPENVAPPVAATISQNTSKQTPQEILQLPQQTLEGEWNVDKWEFWFRNSELSPAVQELAQYGIMSGYIDGESFFHIPQKYEKLLTQLQYALEEALKQQWSNTRFYVQYEDVSETTPYHMQNDRKARAYQRASEMLHDEPVVKSLMDVFDGEIQNIQLK